MESFERLPEPKQQRILNGAYSCFGRNGYRKTSMADIAAAAGVSKAALFAYFGTKQQMFRYLYDRAVGEIRAQMVLGSEDFFECIAYAAREKLKVLEAYPGLLSFAVRGETEVAPEAREVIDQTDEQVLVRSMAEITKTVDWNRFKPPFDQTQVLNLITWLSLGYANTHLHGYTAAQLTDELLGVFEQLKQVLYKEEYLK